MTRADIIAEISASEPQGPRRRRLPDGREVEPGRGGAVRPAAEVRRLQRRRGRAGHLQGPRDPRRVRGPGVRGHDDRAASPSARRRASSTCAASTPTCARTWRRSSQRRRETRLLGRASLGSDGLRLRHRDPDGRRRLRLRRGDGAHRVARGPPRRAAQPPAVPGQHRVRRASRPSSTTSRRSPGSPASWPQGAAWFKSMGTEKSTGLQALLGLRRLRRPGVYEFPMGITVDELLETVGGEGAKAVQVGGASGHCVPAAEFARTLAFEDIATGGSIIVFGPRSRHARTWPRTSSTSSSRSPAASARPAARATRSCSRASSCSSRGAARWRYLRELRRLGRDDAARLQVRPGPVQPQRLPVDRASTSRTRSWAALARERRQRSVAGGRAQAE